MSRDSLLSQIQSFRRDRKEDDYSTENEPTKSKIDVSFGAHFKELWSSSKYSDLELVVGSKKVTLKAHRSILSICKAFATLIDDSKDGKLSFSDEDPDEFKTFIEAIYTSGPGIVTTSNMWKINELSEKYGALHVSEYCATLIAQVLNPESALILLAHINKANIDSPAVKKVLLYIARRATTIFAQSGFLTLPKNVIVALVKLDELSMKEGDLFNRVLAWGKAECKRLDKDASKALKEVLTDILPHIRFPLMSIEDISGDVTASGLIDNTDMIGIFTYVASGGKSTEKLNFSTKKRQTSYG